MIFIDTGAFVARHLKGDQHHREAVPIWERLLHSDTQCFTSNFVVDETITLLARRAGYVFAERVARSLYESADLEILTSDRETEVSALGVFHRFADQEVSFTDCTSFVLMRAHRIHRAFSFDRHFDLPGFTRIPLTS